MSASIAAGLAKACNERAIKICNQVARYLLQLDVKVCLRGIHNQGILERWNWRNFVAATAPECHHFWLEPDSVHCMCAGSMESGGKSSTCCHQALKDG